MNTYIWVRRGMKPGKMYALPAGLASEAVHRLRNEPDVRFVTYARLTDAIEAAHVAARYGGRWVRPLLICANDPWRYELQDIVDASIVALLLDRRIQP